MDDTICEQEYQVLNWARKIEVMNKQELSGKGVSSVLFLSSVLRSSVIFRPGRRAFLSSEVNKATWQLVLSSCLTFLAKSSMSIQLLVETLMDGLPLCLTHNCDAAFGVE